MLDPRFPKWLQTQKNYVELDISNSQISDSIPDGFWNLSSKLRSLDLSNNEIMGTFHDNKQRATNESYVEFPSIT